MPINPKRTRALDLLATTGMWRSDYAPPLVRMLWLCGIDVPPPHFVSFRGNAVSYGTGFCIAFGVARWFIEGSDHTRSMVAILLEHVALSALFGLVMAAIIERGKRKYRLPAWQDL